MVNDAVFTGSTGETTISKQATPEFCLLFQESILLSLMEQGVLNDAQYALCLKALAFQAQ